MKKKISIFPFITFVLVLIVFFYLLVIERDPFELPSVLIDKKVPTFETVSLLNNKTFVSKFNYFWLLLFIPGFILGIVTAFQIDIAETYKNCFVTGIDSHKPSIIEAKKFAQKKKLNNINFQVASLQQHVQLFLMQQVMDQ